MSDWVLGIIGGSGLYEIEGAIGEWKKVECSFGEPSDELFDAIIEGQRVVFLPRHGRGHHLSPSEINYRANIEAMKRLGVTDILSISAVGSLRKEYEPSHFVFPDQFIDRTYKREKTFFENGIIAHVPMAHPICERLSKIALLAAHEAGAKTHNGGTYLAMEGPQFSTKAESELYRQWGCDVIGMTNMPEAKLAREAQIPYATLAMITDYDCWNEEHDSVDVASIVKILNQNSKKAKETIRLLARILKSQKREPSPYDTALEGAIITKKDAQPIETAKKLEWLIGK